MLRGAPDRHMLPTTAKNLKRGYSCAFLRSDIVQPVLKCFNGLPKRRVLIHLDSYESLSVPKLFKIHAGGVSLTQCGQRRFVHVVEVVGHAAIQRLQLLSTSNFKVFASAPPLLCTTRSSWRGSAFRPSRAQARSLFTDWGFSADNLILL